MAVGRWNLGEAVVVVGPRVHCMTEAEDKCCLLEADLVRRKSFSVHMRRMMTVAAVGMSRRLTAGVGRDLYSNRSFRHQMDGLRRMEGLDKVHFRTVPYLVVDCNPVCVSCRFGTDGLLAFDRNNARRMRVLSANPRARRAYSLFHHMSWRVSAEVFRYSRRALGFVVPEEWYQVVDVEVFPRELRRG